jgi:hypothetical protein
MRHSTGVRHGSIQRQRYVELTSGRGGSQACAHLALPYSSTVQVDSRQ